MKGEVHNDHIYSKVNTFSSQHDLYGSTNDKHDYMNKNYVRHARD
jgi:hypothetical protein